VGALKLTPPSPIAPEHDASGFTCRHDALSDWLQRRAWANEQVGASRTYVVCTEDNKVVGYYALAAGSVDPNIAVGAIRRNMPKPVPVIVLGRLAVHRDWSGQGIGRGLLKDALSRTIQASQLIGIRAMLCHAVDEEAKAFYLKHGFVQSPIEVLTLMLGLNP